ncbi:hypothetical protein [uncultured Nitratireductor sp.]|nr:hypothetical protein [uncultured Nitratireductor sp.]
MAITAGLPTSLKVTEALATEFYGRRIHHPVIEMNSQVIFLIVFYFI